MLNRAVGFLYLCASIATAQTSINLNVTPGNAPYGTPQSVAVQVSGGNDDPSGSVTVMDGSNVLKSLSVTAGINPQRVESTVKSGSAVGADSVVFGDFNEDGILDAIGIQFPIYGCTSLPLVINEFSGMGDGTLASGINVITSNTTDADFVYVDRDPIVVDANGDGHLDLVVAFNQAFGIEQIGAFYGDGTGHFSTLTPIYTPEQGSSLSPGLFLARDLNGDGRIDLLVSNGQTKRLLLRQAVGTYQMMESPATMGDGLREWSAADLDADGFADLVVVDGKAINGGLMATLYWAKNNGDGSFGMPQILYSATSSTSVDYPFQSLRAVDVNADGKIDLCIFESSTNSNACFLNTGNDTFASKMQLPFSGNIQYERLFSAQASDLITAVYDPNTDTTTVDLRRNTGDMTFPLVQQIILPRGSDSANTRAGSFRVADIDGNGANDLALLVQPVGFGLCTTVTGSQLAVYLGTRAGFVSFITNQLKGGVHSISAKYSGDSTHPAANSTAQVVSIDRIFPFPNISIAQQEPFMEGEQLDITLSAQFTGSPTPPLAPSGVATLFDGTTRLGQVTLDSSGKGTLSIRISAPGVHHLAMTYEGDQNYLPSTTRPEFIRDLVLLPAFTMTSSSSSLSVRAGTSTSVTLNFAPVNFSGTLNLSCAGLPAASTCSFSPQSVALSGGSASSTVTITTTGQSASLTPLPFSYAGTPIFALFVGAMPAWRYRRTRRMRALLFSLFAGSLLIACGGGGGSSSIPHVQASTPPGTYTVNLVATSSTSQKVLPVTVVVQ